MAGAAEEELVAAGFSAVFARILASRGMRPGAALDEYLDPALSRLAAPSLLPGAEEAAATILDAVSRRERIVVFGDYDCDGICAAAIVATAVKAVAKGGPEPAIFIPDRLSEGYGMRGASVARMLRESPDAKLVVTVDNGIGSAAEVKALGERGVAVVVTDHHLPGDTIPAAAAVVNPKVSAPPDLEGLCGAGVAFMVANALVSLAKRRGLYSGPSVGGPLLVLAGLATVVDVMPLVGQNRILVSEALRRFRSLAPVGLRELFDRASRTARQELDSKDFGFVLGPRINAAGRMASAMESLALVLAGDREEARSLAMRVDLRNQERRQAERAMLDAATPQVAAGAAAQVIEIPGGHLGVMGIVAARVLEALDEKTPVCVVVDGHGSARAPEGYNVRDALEASAAALESFGGHAAAAGFVVRPGALGDFKRLFCASCAGQAAKAAALASESAGKVDAQVRIADVTEALADEISKMKPFGEGNEEPRLRACGVRLADARPVGADGRHLSVLVGDNPVRGCLRTPPLRAVWWGHGADAEGLRSQAHATFEVVFRVGVSDYGGRHVELAIEGLSPETPETAA